MIVLPDGSTPGSRVEDAVARVFALLAGDPSGVERADAAAIALRLWLTSPPEHPLAAAIAQARADTVGRGWCSGPVPPDLPGDADWVAWRFFEDVVFVHPTARVVVYGAGLHRRGDRRSEWAWRPGRLGRARVDVPTGRGARTAIAEVQTPDGIVRVELRGSRLRVRGPARQVVGTAIRVEGDWRVEE